MKTFLFALIILSASFVACVDKKKTPPYTSPDSGKGAALYGTKNDSAFYYFNSAVNNSTDSFQIALAYHYMALIQSEAGDYFGSQETVLSSQQFLRKDSTSDYYLVALNYNILGTTSLSLKQYDQALSYYDDAMKFDTSSAGRIYYLNNKALVFQKKKAYKEAVAVYQSLIDVKIDSIAEYARVLSNLARSKWLADSNYNAAPELWTALYIRQTKSDSWGINASYAHLADYYTASHSDSALFYARERRKVSVGLGSPDDELEALQKLVDLEAPAIAKNYFNRYMELNDSLQLARNRAKNQFAVIRFDAEKSKADNLVLQAENKETRNRVTLQNFILIGTLAFFLAVAIVSVIWYKKRKQRMELEKLNEIQQNQLKMSGKIHDVVANGLYRLMSEIEHNKLAKEPMLDRMEKLYHQSRDISYEPSLIVVTPFEEKIHDLLDSFSSQATRLLIVGNNPIFWEGISPEIRQEFEHVLQELMINMKKHSRAENVAVKFESTERQCSIRYTDDGIGMDERAKSGVGLRNTGNRILAIGGTINFEPTANKGLRVDIAFQK